MRPVRSEAPSAGARLIEQFAADLRRLRIDAGNPTLSRLQADSGVSRTVLAEAFAGRQLPSERTVAGIVRALRGDAREWLERRDALVHRTAPSQEQSPSTSARVTRRTTVLIAIGAFTLGALAATTTTLAVMHPASPPAGPAVLVKNGQDPAVTLCVRDAKVAASATRADNALLEIIWSDRCQAGWARITRYDDLAHGNTLSVAIYPETSPAGAGREEATEHDVQSAYTPLLKRPSPHTLLCAEGSFTVNGTRTDLGDPLCT